MIKKVTIIRNLKEKHKKMLQQVQEKFKIKTGTKTFLFVLENFIELQEDNERLQRIIAYKQKKIDSLKEQIDASI